MDSFVVFDYCCLVLFSFFYFTNLFFWSGNRLWNDQNHVVMGVLLTHIIVNIISEHVELTRTVNAVSESNWLIDWLEFNGTVSTVRLYRAFRSTYS